MSWSVPTARRRSVCPTLPSTTITGRRRTSAGRKELERPHKLAEEWRSVRADLVAAREDGDLRELVPELETHAAELEEELKLALVETDPADSKDVIVEVRQAWGR